MHGEVINAEILGGYSGCCALEIKRGWEDIKIFVKKTLRNARVGFSCPKTESDDERGIEITGLRKVWIFIGHPGDYYYQLCPFSV